MKPQIGQLWFMKHTDREPSLWLLTEYEGSSVDGGGIDEYYYKAIHLKTNTIELVVFSEVNNPEWMFWA